MSFLENYSGCCPFNRLFVGLVLSCVSFLYILGIRLLLDISFGNIIYHILGCLFVLLMVSFAVQEINLM